MRLAAYIALSLFMLLSLSPLDSAQTAEKGFNWEEIVSQSRGATVDWYMWGGSPAVNSYVNGYLADALKKEYGITLRQVPVKDIGEIVSKLLVEKQAGKAENGSVDLLWINGENFRTCKDKGLLHGPFADKIPNSSFVDWENPSVKNDFGTPVEYMESPWGSAQMVMIYDSARMESPPRTIPALLDWIQQNPGRFSYPAPPDFTGSAFMRHLFYHASGDPLKWQGEYSEEDLQQAADKTYSLLTGMKKSLWRQGTTYPESPVRLNTLFADGEVELSFSYNQGEASRNILDGIFPESVRTYVFEEGTLANTHFVAIPFNAADKAAAMVVANFLLSPEAQLEKSKPEVWGDFPAISTAKLTPDMQQKFIGRPKGVATLDDSLLQSHQLPEPPSTILTRLEKGWQEHVLKGR